MMIRLFKIWFREDMHNFIKGLMSIKIRVQGKTETILIRPSELSEDEEVERDGGKKRGTQRWKMVKYYFNND
jgi:hypothetical protein